MRIVEEHMAYTRMLRDLGAYVSGEALDDPRGSSVVVRPGETPIVSDGPFAETKEAIGGFYVVDVADRDRGDRARRAGPAQPRARGRGADDRGVLTTASLARPARGPEPAERDPLPVRPALELALLDREAVAAAGPDRDPGEQERVRRARDRARPRHQPRAGRVRAEPLEERRPSRTRPPCRRRGRRR